MIEIYRKNEQQHNIQADVLAIAAHPDDVELSIGGSIIKLTDEHKSVVVADATEGELGSRGTIYSRREEAVLASKIMNIDERINLQIPDGNVTAEQHNVEKVVSVIRKYKPVIVLGPAGKDRHPDHEAVHQIVRKAVFLSGIRKFHEESSATYGTHRPKHVFWFMQTYDFVPDFLIDISTVYDRKVEAMKAYSTQFFVTDVGNEPQTFISRPEFGEFLQARARAFGDSIGVRYAEPFQRMENIGFETLGNLLDVYGGVR